MARIGLQVRPFSPVTTELPSYPQQYIGAQVFLKGSSSTFLTIILDSSSVESSKSHVSMIFTYFAPKFCNDFRKSSMKFGWYTYIYYMDLRIFFKNGLQEVYFFTKTSTPSSLLDLYHRLASSIISIASICFFAMCLPMPTIANLIKLKVLLILYLTQHSKRVT